MVLHLSAHHESLVYQQIWFKTEKKKKKIHWQNNMLTSNQLSQLSQMKAREDPNQ